MYNELERIQEVFKIRKKRVEIFENEILKFETLVKKQRLRHIFVLEDMRGKESDEREVSIATLKEERQRFEEDIEKIRQKGETLLEEARKELLEIEQYLP